MDRLYLKALLMIFEDEVEEVDWNASCREMTGFIFDKKLQL